MSFRWKYKKILQAIVEIKFGSFDIAVQDGQAAEAVKAAKKLTEVVN